jgi:hypothetical protein
MGVFRRRRAYGTAEQDRTYHGIPSKEEHGEWESARIFVEKPEEGPTEREDVTVWAELPAPDDGDFGWGYDGHGTSRAAAAILADALELGDPEECGIAVAAYPSDLTLTHLRENFCHEVLSQCCDEWRMRRGLILRWARGWYLQHGITDLPEALRQLPPLPNI